MTQWDNFDNMASLFHIKGRQNILVFSKILHEKCHMTSHLVSLVPKIT